MRRSSWGCARRGWCRAGAGAGTVKADAGATSPAAVRQRHVDLAPVPAHEPVQRGRGPVARDSGLAARQDGGHDLGAPVPAGVADGVDARVHPVQLSFVYAPCHRAAVESGGGELIDAHAPLLQRRLFRDPPVRRWAESFPPVGAHSAHSRCTPASAMRPIVSGALCRHHASSQRLRASAAPNHALPRWAESHACSGRDSARPLCAARQAARYSPYRPCCSSHALTTRLAANTRQASSTSSTGSTASRRTRTYGQPSG